LKPAVQVSVSSQMHSSTFVASTFAHAMVVGHVFEPLWQYVFGMHTAVPHVQASVFCVKPLLASPAAQAAGSEHVPAVEHTLLATHVSFFTPVVSESMQ
jgi:hypothetical protein